MYSVRKQTNKLLFSLHKRIKNSSFVARNVRLTLIIIKKLRLCQKLNQE